MNGNDDVVLIAIIPYVKFYPLLIDTTSLLPYQLHA